MYGQKSKGVLASLIAGSMRAYLDPVPPAEMSMEARERMAWEIAERWFAKEARGEYSCAWHEITLWLREQKPGVAIACPCGPCVEAALPNPMEGACGC